MSKPRVEMPASSIHEPPTAEDASMPRRVVLKKLGRFAAVTPPAVTLMLAAKARPAVAASPAPGSSRQLKDRVGDVDGAALSLTFAGIGAGAPIDMIDGVGACLAAIKALHARVESLEASL
jgi:hypothetical protein